MPRLFQRFSQADVASTRMHGGLALGLSIVRELLTLHEALQAFRVGPPDLVVSDIAMPEQDGYALIGRVRSMPGEAGRTPAIALTAYAFSVASRVRRSATALGSAGFVRW